MTLNPNNIITRPRHSVRERKLARDIRDLPEEQRTELIRVLLQRDEVVALILAKNCVSDKKFFEELLEQGLRTANASSITDWLACIVPKLGFRKVVARLIHKLENDPNSVQSVDKARYQLFRFVPKNDARAVKAWRDLNELITKHR